MDKKIEIQGLPLKRAGYGTRPGVSQPAFHLLVSKICSCCRIGADPFRQVVSILALASLACFWQAVSDPFDSRAASTDEGQADALFNMWLDPPESDPAVDVYSEATYSVTFRGLWTTAVTSGGLPGGAHFTNLIGGVHNAGVTFLRDGGRATAGVEFMAELGGTSTLAREVRAAEPDALAVLLGSGNIGPTGSSTIDDVTLTTDHSRVTLLTMIAPSPDWFVGVSGLSLLDEQGEWMGSLTVNLYPWDAGTEDGTEFSLSNPDTTPRGVITSIRGSGKFSNEPIATLTFTLQSVETAEIAPELLVSTLVSGLTIPWDLDFTPDGTMLFTEKRGVLSSRRADGTIRRVNAEMGDLFAVDETGLMGIVVDPDFASNRRFYTCQGHVGPEIQVIAWTMNAAYTAATRVADPLVGGMPATSGRHGGCRLRFGPEGYLWIATGDAASGSVPQDLASLGGKVLRVDPSTGAGAETNPLASPRIYSYGHRNVQGLALRPGTRQMWAVEHGPRADDEINLLVAGGNYGWDPVPGYNESVPMTDRVKFPDAVEAKWSSGSPTLAVSGGIFLEGNQWGVWEGRLAVATLRDSRLRLFEFTPEGDFVGQVIVSELDRSYGRLRTPMMGPDGALYVTTSNGGGRDLILRIGTDAEVIEDDPAELSEADLEDRRLTLNLAGGDGAARTLELRFGEGNRFEQNELGTDSRSGTFTYEKTGPRMGTVRLDYDDGTSCELRLSFNASGEGTFAYVCGDGGPDVGSFRLTTGSLFVPVILSSAGQNQSFFTSELTLTNRGEEEVELDYTYTSRDEPEKRSGRASDVLPAGRQKIANNALTYLAGLGIPIPATGNQLGTLRVEVPPGSDVEAVVRTTTIVPDGRAGLAYPGVAEEEGFSEPVYLCGLRQNSQDRSNVAFQNMGAPGEGAITLKTSVYSGEASDMSPRELDDITLGPGGFYQYSGLPGGVENGYVKVERVEGEAPFYAYGVINDQANSDGSFIFPVTASSLEGKRRQTLPVIVETAEFTSELTVTNFSEEPRRLNFEFVSERIQGDDKTVGFRMELKAGEQQIVPELVEALRREGMAGLGERRGFYLGALFVTAEEGDLSGVVIGARTSSQGGGGQYGVFYNAVPEGEGFDQEAWVEGLQQNAENRSNLALVNTGEVDGSPSVFHLEIYNGETGVLEETVVTRPIPARGWHQIDRILLRANPETRQGYIRIEKVSGQNPFLAYGVINDGGAPGQRSGDGAYLPARE